MRPETSLEIGLKMDLETNQWMAIEFHDLADCPAGLAWMQQVDCIKITFFDGFICMERGSTSDPFLSPRLRGPTQGCQPGHQQVKVLSRLAVSMFRQMPMPPKRSDRGN